MRKTCPIWARLLVRIRCGFLAVPQESAFPKDALFLVLCNFSSSWMPFQGGGIPLAATKGLLQTLQLQAGMPPYTGYTLS